MIPLPEINDKKFYSKLLRKKEFYENRIGNNGDIYPLQPHQRLLSQYINPRTPYESILVVHAVGTGKTLTGIAIAREHLPLVPQKIRHIIFVTKNESIYENIKLEMTEDPKLYEYTTFNKLKSIKNLSNCLIIIDEAHNVTENKTYDQLMLIKSKSVNLKIVLLTATPVTDTVYEIFNLCNILTEKPLFSDQRREIQKQELVKSERVTEKGMIKLRNALKGKVSFLNQDNQYFPRVLLQGRMDPHIHIKVVECPMSGIQEEFYNKYDKDELEEDGGVPLYSLTSYASNIVFPKGELNIISKSKQIFDSSRLGQYSSKLLKILENINNYNGKHFVYSVYINSGVEAVADMLRRNKISFTVISSEDSVKTRLKKIKKFNLPENNDGSIVKVILGSVVLAEGFSFKNTKNVHILEPFWNMSRLDQVIGRAVRYRSHEMLPKEQRIVRVFKYCSTIKEKETVDVVKYKTCVGKDSAIKKIEQLLKEIAFDCSLNKERNIVRGVPGSRECNYGPCEYVCDSEKEEKSTRFSVDYSTYIGNKDEIKYCNSVLLELFEKRSGYTLGDIVNIIGKRSRGVVDDVNVYLALTQLMNIIITIKGKKGSIKNLEDNYIFVPEGVALNKEFILLEKSLPVSPKAVKETIQTSNSSSSRLIPKPKPSSVSSRKSKPKVTPVVVKPLIIKQISKKLYGSFFNKFGENDKIFRIVDKRSETQKKDKREVVTGKVCTSFSKTELQDISNYLGLTLPEKSKKIDTCKSIQRILEEREDIH